MGSIADQFAATLAAMRAADERAAAATRETLASIRETIAALDADPVDVDPIADAIALLREHGYTVTPPA